GRVGVGRGVAEGGMAADEVGEGGRGKTVPVRRGYGRATVGRRRGLDRTGEEQADRYRLRPFTGGGGAGLRHERVGHVRRQALTYRDYKFGPRIGNPPCLRPSRSALAGVLNKIEPRLNTAGHSPV